MVVGSSQPLTDVSIRNLPSGEGRPTHEADNLTAIKELMCHKIHTIYGEK
jgi:hypothetical protein